MNKPTIHQANSKDAVELSSVCSRSFIETYEGKGKKRPKEMVYEYVRKKFNPKVLLEEINASPIETWVLVSNKKIIGYFKLIKEIPPDFVKNKNLIHLERIYLLKEFHQKGFGKALLAKAEERAIEMGHDGIWLGVWDENQAAIQFYNKNGFKKVGSHNWEFDYQGFHYVDTDDVFTKILT